MSYTVIINYRNETARLDCETWDQAVMVRQSFINWGGMGYDIEIVAEKP